MRKHNISANLVRTLELLYGKATSAVQVNGSMGECFRITVEICKDVFCDSSSSTFFPNGSCLILWEKHDGKISVGGKNNSNLRLTDYKDALAQKGQKLEALDESLDKTCIMFLDRDQC